MTTGKKWSERKLEEEMKKLGQPVLMSPTAPTHPLLGQNLNTGVKRQVKGRPAGCTCDQQIPSAPSQLPFSALDRLCLGSDSG